MGLLRRVGLRVVRPPDLQHGQASLLLAAGVPPAVVSRRLGRSSYALTVDAFSHMLEGVGREAAQGAASLIPRQIPADSLATERRDDSAALPERTEPQGDRVRRQGLEPRTR